MNIGMYIVPSFLLLAFGMAFFNKSNAFDDFVDGAKDGMNSVRAIIPTFIGMLVATKVFLASGIMDRIGSLFQPVLGIFGIDTATLPLMVLRPLSGSASLSFTNELLQIHGPDSFVGRLASVMLASSDTTIYIVTIYLAAVGIRQMKHALSLGIIIDIISFILAAFFVAIFFG